MTGTTIGPHPTKYKCPYCNVVILSMIKRKAGMKTHLAAFLLCICQCWLCMCIPYFINSCLDTVHYCPNCSALLGTYER